MKIDIGSLTEVDTHTKNRLAMEETSSKNEEKVIFMQQIRSFLFIFGLDKLNNLKEVYTDFRNTLNCGSDIK